MFKSKHDQRTVLHSPFNHQIHKETFLYYLEVVIFSDGTVEYAVPSHQLKVVDFIAKRDNITREQVGDMCPPEYYCDYDNWLCKEAGAIMVWNDFYRGVPNDKQILSLIKLMTEGLYLGNIEVDRAN